MAVDRTTDGIDADVETAGRESAADRRPPPDKPGAAEFPSRADSRSAAMAANTETDEAAFDPAEQEGAVAEQDESRTSRSASGRDQSPPAGDRSIVDGEKGLRPYAERFDVPIGEDEPTPREVLEHFDLACAGLPEISENDARDYIGQNAEDRPWLALAKDRDPAVQRVIAAMDQGQGHALERHEGYAEDDRLVRRVTALEDPAQLDPQKRAAGVDGCKPGNRDHMCGDSATAIQDMDAFATTFVRGIGHPDVGRRLQEPFIPGKVPSAVSLPVKELLGSDGADYCSGYRLEPVGGSLAAAQDRRMAWVSARRNPGREPDVSEPRCARIDSFEGAEVKYLFRPKRDKSGYEVSTMYVEPPQKIASDAGGNG